MIPIPNRYHFALGLYKRLFPKALVVCNQNFRTFCSTKKYESPLSGIKVIDLTRIVAGPYCTMILGDLGADVYKIEQPGSGDEARKWGPPYVEGSDSSCYFVSLNRNKKSVCVNLKTTEGVNIIKNLAKVSDILIENFVPGKLDALGIGYSDMKTIAPRLIYLSLTGYGSKGPYKNRPGYDVIAASIGGLLHITGPTDGDPCKPGVAMTDLATGLFAHGAILAALLQREKTGLGQKIDCNLLSTQVASLINIGSNYLNAGKDAKRWGTAHESIVPYQTFPTSDGFITVGAGSNQQFKSLCDRINMPDLIEDVRFVDNKARVKNREALIEKLKKCFFSKTTAEWLNCLEGALFPYGQVNRISEVFKDEHIQSIGLVKNVKMADGVQVRLVGPPVDFSDSLNAVRLPPPLLGQHTAEILSEVLNYSSEKIKMLKENGDIISDICPKKSALSTDNKSHEACPYRTVVAQHKLKYFEHQNSALFEKDPHQDLPTLRLRLKKPKSRKQVKWGEDTIDNENMNKKKSKCCCIYNKPKAFGESSSESDDECDNCQGHVERRKKVLSPDHTGPGPSSASPPLLPA